MPYISSDPALLTLRIYALYQRSKRLAAMLSSFAFLAGVACFVMFGQESAPAPQLSNTGCNVGISRITAIRRFLIKQSPDDVAHVFRVPINRSRAWEALFAYDSIIFTLTIWKTVKERRERRITGSTLLWWTLLLRDGAIYYAISATMMSRLMLNLHRTADEGIYTTQITNTHFDLCQVSDDPGACRAGYDMERPRIREIDPPLTKSR
ncbi:hypothetical protein BKA70DRAFT_1426674 [Coprinopsis sp. MPI-PUGE-AT-0042]|nr:hypothetical protein BKA70DRAFT_1426674 [Coprinopsis sp. MPI-PUGE-AT-0042]